jgi:F0F1-type ATP synthase assembly protein I
VKAEESLAFGHHQPGSQMSTDVLRFLAFGVPFICFIAGWFVFFGKRNGVLKMSWREVIITEAGLLILAAASFILATEIMQRL